MANQTTSQTLYDGNTNVVMQFTGINDGTGDETLVKKVDVALLLPAPKTVKIVKIKAAVSGGIVQMLWEANDPMVFLTIADYLDEDYSRIGGMVNAAGDGVTGNILFSTLGFDAGSSYAITLEMKKKF